MNCNALDITNCLDGTVWRNLFAFRLVSIIIILVEGILVGKANKCLHLELLKMRKHSTIGAAAFIGSIEAMKTPI